jgi:tetratricopeptide (TPR) repeat protein
MRRFTIAYIATRLAVIVSFAACLALAQAGAPSSIQIFMPGGALPDRFLRFTLTRDDGRVETLFTDTKGKFLITGDLVREADYTIRVESDERTFATTVATFRTFRNNVTYVPVFLKPLEERKRNPPAVLNVTDVNVPAKARDAYEQAMREVASGESEKAISDLKRAIGMYPRYLRALNDLGVLYLHLNQLADAAAFFEQAIKIDRTFLYPRLNLGVVLNRQGKHTEAGEILGQLYQENPQLGEAELPYADALAETGKLAEAEKVLRHALENTSLGNSAQAEAHFRLGAVLNRQNRFPEAVAELEKAIKLEPNAVMAHLQLGGALIQLKRLPQAERELLKAYELGGKSAGAAQFLLGQVYYLQLKYELALRAFAQYLKDVPNAPNAAEVNHDIEKIKTALKQK